MPTLFRVIAGLFLTIFLASGVSAHEMKFGDLVINQAIIPATVKAAPVAAGYLKITNNGTDADRLVSVSTGFSGKSEIHTMKMIDGVMRMRPLKDGIVINPGETVVLERGGLHLMFMKLEEQMEIGQMRKATLVFEIAGTVEIKLMVIDPANLDGKAMDHSSHTN